MGIYDRPYWKDEQQGSGGGGGMGGGFGGMRVGLPKPTPAVLGLIVSCFVFFLFQQISGPLNEALVLDSRRPWQVWRFVSFQFLHGGVRHLLFNMLGLYFFGPPLERIWGTKRFLTFYLACGVFGGVCFLVLAAITSGMDPFLLGASAGVLGCLAGCAILFPQLIVLIFPIRWVAGFYAVMYVMTVLFEKNLSDAAHLGGMLAAGLWIYLGRRIAAGAGAGGPGLREKLNDGAWQKKMDRLRREQEEVDRILEKIQQEGLASLSRKEKQILQDATRRQKERERHMDLR